MAHLMELSGESLLASEIRARSNFAAVPEIAQDPRVVDWLLAAGFTREELVLIQPSYCSVTPADCVCRYNDGHGPGKTIVIELERVAPKTGQVVAVYGGPAPEIAAVGEQMAFWTDGLIGDRTLHLMGAADRRRAADQPQSDAGIAAPTAPRALKIAGEMIAPCDVRAPPLTKQQAITALLSPGVVACRDYLASLDGDWDDDTCGLFSCDVTSLAGSSASSVAVLLAVVGAIAARRAARHAPP